MKRTLVAALAAVLLGPSVAVAQAIPQPVFDLERLSLDPAAVSSMVIGTGEALPAHGFRLSLAAHYENRPLVLLTDGTVRGGGIGADSRQGDLVTHRVTGHLGLAYQLLAPLEVNVRLPVVAWQEGTAGLTSPSLSSSGLGGTAAGLRWQAARQGEEAPLSVALASEVVFPGGKKEALAGTDGWAFTPRVEAGHRFSGLVVGAQAGALLRSRTTDFGGQDGKLRSELQLGAVIATTGAPLRGELSVRGSVGRHIEETVEVLAGGRYAFAGGFEVFALAGPGFRDAPGTPRFRGVLGLAWAPVCKAPAKAAPPPAPVAVDPCAPGQAHTPAQCPALDDDQDGVLNRDDACPTVAGIPEEKGCPAKDTDKDGVPDHKDRCPAVAGLAELQGCPAVDTDGDGIPDHLDKCPLVAGVAAEGGCPPPTAKAKLNVETKKIDILEKVYFDTGKATIQPRSFALLDAVAQVLKDNAQVTRVLVEGHTDDTGPAELNTRLSGERADAVKAYLVGKGVDGARLDSKGFGPSRSVGDNKTKAGREQNRRVEFTIP